MFRTELDTEEIKYFDRQYVITVYCRHKTKKMVRGNILPSNYITSIAFLSKAETKILLH